MDFRILGALEVRTSSGEPCQFTRRKERLLLAALLLNANQPVPSERLIDWLWDRPPASAAQNLHTYISDLRRRLGDADRIRTQTGRYRIQVEPGELDAESFDSLVTQGLEATRQHRYGLAVERLTRALGLWRSAVPLEGLPLPGELLAETTRLGQVRLVATETLFEARLAEGQHRELIPDLERATRRHPYQERLWAQRMLALYRAGRPGDALAAYHEIRSLLASELGTVPSKELEQLHERITAADPGLRPSASAARAIPKQLPADLSTFTGRLKELTRLDGPAAHPAPRIWAIDGMPGIGKTTLAVHVGHRLAEHFPDGQLFVDLHGFTKGMAPVDPAQALDRMLRSLGVSGDQIPRAVEERAALLRTCLSGKRVLIVLDNAIDERQVAPLVPGAGGCLVLVTSRQRLAGLDGARPISLDVLDLPDAIALFTRTAGLSELGEPGELPAGAAEQVANVVELCGRLPLAIRIAAARLQHRPTWSPATVAERLRDERNRLVELEAGQRSVAAAFDLSYLQLGEAHQRAFRLLGLCPGADVEAPAAAALLGGDVYQAGRLLDDLLDAHLVHQQHPKRFQLHDLLRAHAARICAEEEPEPERSAALERLFDHYVERAAAAADLAYPFERGHRAASPAVTFDDPVAAVAWLDTELPNLAAVAARCAAAGDLARCLRLSDALHWHLLTRAHYAQAEALQARALDAARAADDLDAEPELRCRIGQIHRLQGRYDLAADSFRQAYALARDSGDSRGELQALFGLGRVDYLQGRYAQAADGYGRALTLADELGEVRTMHEILAGLANVHRTQGQYEQAAVHYERSLLLAGGLGYAVGELHALAGLGRVHLVQGRPDEALGNFERALALSRDTGYPGGELRALCGLGRVCLELGRREDAKARFQSALRLARDMGDRNYEFEALHGLGLTEHAVGEAARALDTHQQALRIAVELGQPTDEARACHGLYRASVTLGGNDGEARRWLGQAVQILERLGLAQAEEVELAALRTEWSALERDA